MGSTNHSSPFILSRATPEDLPEMLEVQYTCFGEQGRSIFMGTPTREHLPNIREHYLQEMRSDRSIVWLKVVDKANNKIIAGSQWQVYVNGEPAHEAYPHVMGWQDPESKKLSESIRSKINERRKAAMPGPFVYLHICFTSEAYRRRGAGGMMMQWGVNLMDLLFLPGWIEASPDGKFLYETFGFEEYERLEIREGMTLSNMKRNVGKGGVEGGK